MDTSSAHRHAADVCIGPENGWAIAEFSRAKVSFKGYLFDGARTLAGLSAADHANRLLANAVGDASLNLALGSLAGHFALIIETPQRVVATVDRVRSVPLLWGQHNGTIHIDDRGRRLCERLGLSAAKLDADQTLAVAMSGYTVGSKTLYQGMRQLRPGEALINDNQGPRTKRWFIYDAWRTQPASSPERHLSDLHRFLIERLAASAEGRTICVPLSAGLDSRMIAAGLKEVGYRNVRLFAYGRPGNHEAEMSKAIAERLGFPWAFVPFTDVAQRGMFADLEHHQKLWEDADTCGCVPFEQDWIALQALKSNGWIPPDALIVNGQSGDFITGNHVPKTLFENVPNDEAARRQLIYDSIFSKHYSLWSALLTPNNKVRIANLLTDESDSGGVSLVDPSAPHGVYEFLEYQDRQAKYVISGQRTYEALDYAWRLPLWDDEYVMFWRRIPVEYKAHQSLYRKTLLADDWGGVWKYLPVNAKTIRPRWIVPLRIAAKLAFAPLGADRWHRAERRLFQWWMDPLRLSAVVPYSKAVRDNRGARHALAWLTDRYLMQHGVDINALFE